MNHDDLKNGLCLRLARSRNVLEGWVEVVCQDEIFPSQEESDILFAEIAELIQAFPRQMSPKILFDEPLLCHCDLSVRDWLPDVIHKLWIERYGVIGLIGYAETTLQNTIQAQCDFFLALNSGTNWKRRPHLLQSLKAFQAEVNILSAAISRFPDRILLP